MAEVKKPESVIRLEKYQELKKLGENPYPSVVPEFITVPEAREKKAGEVVATVGKITAMREHGKLTFVDVTEEDEKIQIFANAETKNYDRIKLLDTGDFIWTEGELFITKAGELTIKAKEIKILSKSLLPIPESWNELIDVETRYRQRTLDFKVNKEAREVIKARSKIVAVVREFLDRHGFIEIQTPILQPIPGGAAAKPFVTHYNILDVDFYLRIAPELYLKRLVAGGFERVYEIGPSFRNEGLSHMHNPEFTTCEFYWAYRNYEDLMKITQKMIQKIVLKIHKSLKLTYQDQPLDFSGDFKIEEYADLIKKETGIDINEQDTFEKLEAAVKKAGIKISGDEATVWSKLVDELFKKSVRPKIVQPLFVKDYPAQLSPLAKALESDPKTVQCFQLICAGGFELVKAYSELNDPIVQEKRFDEQMKMRKEGYDEGEQKDDNFIEALKYGMPPTAGWGMGIERLTMILTNQHSIKEVIPFPTLKPITKPKAKK